MPGGQTKYKEKWLEEKDQSGGLIGNWCGKGRNEWEAYCKLCNTYLSVSNGGISQLHQHTTRKKHMAAAKQMKTQSTLFHLSSKSADSEISGSLNTIELTTVEQLATKAEAVWCMKIADSNFSFDSCKDMVPVLNIMVPENPIINAMHLSERKASYVLSHGLGPYFFEELVSDLKASLDSGCHFTLSFDETTTTQIKKQLDLYIRFWSLKSNKIVCAYLTSMFLGHATADIVCRSISDFLNEQKIPLKKILMLGMDGPNVNLAISKKLTIQITEESDEPFEFVDIGTCSLHKVHNCFSKALDHLNLDIDEFATDLFAFFRLSAARREDLKEMEKLLECEEKFLLRHVSSRWLTLGPVVARILSIYPALKEYFLKFLPKDKASWTRIQNSARYKRIVCVLKNPQSVVYLEFVTWITTSCLQRYLTVFQTEGPLVHLLYHESNVLIRTVMLMFMKEDCVGQFEGKKLLDVGLEDHKHYKSLKNMNIGMGVIRALSSLNEKEEKEARMDIRSFLIKLAQLLRQSLPFTHGLLKDLEQLLHPSLRSSGMDNAVRRLCTRLSPLKMTDNITDTIVQECQMYRLDAKVEELVKNFNLESPKKSIDIFWSSIFDLVDEINGRKKYSNLSILVKNCLSLSHGNSDVERGFSFNSNILSKARQNISEEAIIGLRQVKDSIRRIGSISNVTITKKMLNAVRRAHAAYAMEKERKRKESEDLQKKKRILDEEIKVAEEAKRKKEEISEKKRKIENEIKALQDDLQAAQKYMDESNEKLQSAIKRKDYSELKVLSTAIEVANKKIQSISDEIKRAHSKRAKQLQ